MFRGILLITTGCCWLVFATTPSSPILSVTSPAILTEPVPKATTFELTTQTATTLVPTTTTPKPTTTTPKPTTTTPKPTTTTPKPTTTTPQPTTTTQTPTTTTPKPTTTTPKPTTTTPKPTTTTPKPTTTTPKPTTTTPKPTTTTPKPTTTTPRPTTTTPKPTTTTPKPTTTTPKPTTTTPKPTTTTPKPTTTTPKPTTTTPKPTTTTPKLIITTPKPTTTTPKPTTTTPKPTTTTPKPTTTTPKPTTTTPKPTTTTPTPTTTTPLRSTPDPRANKTVCYKELGCFDNKPPYDNAGLDLPNSPEVINTTFMLYTRKNKLHDEGQLLNYTGPNSITISHFDEKKKTKIIIHGFSNDLNTDWLHLMKDEFLKADDFNVIIVGWGNGATFPDYSQAVANTRLVATQTQRLIKQMLKLGLSLDDVHLIGHSLGAHTSGYCGFLLKGKLNRITGLDIAGPDYRDTPIAIRLEKTDAQFVDIIHSNGKPVVEGGAGMYKQSGHVDFYLNGGQTQPGCTDGIGAIFEGGNIKKNVACSHGRSHEVFIESINSQCPFTAYPCDSYADFEGGECLTCGKRGCSVLGYYSDQYNARGRMFLATSAKKPYCGYHYGITVYGSEDTKDTKGTISIKLKGKWGDSGFIPATQKDGTLLKDTVFSHILVSPQEVGDVESVTVKYDKKKVWFFGGGEDTYAVDKVVVMSGENGSTYTFCLPDRQLKHATEAKTIKSSSKYKC